jgi:hypothetical protein
MSDLRAFGACTPLTALRYTIFRPRPAEPATNQPNETCHPTENIVLLHTSSDRHNEDDKNGQDPSGVQ